MENVEDLIKMDQYTLLQEKKERILLEIMREQLKEAVGQNTHLRNFYSTFNVDLDKVESLIDIPPIPVNLFKKYDLTTCPRDKVIRVLNSSSTTTGIPSVIPLDATTANRQKKGLLAILKSMIGKQRRPYLVFDSPSVNDPKKKKLTARGAAIRGIENFSKKTYYIMKEEDGGRLVPNLELLEQIQEEHGQEELLGFGFTFMVWTSLIQELQKEGRKFSFPKLTILHSGGWKKLEAQKVSKEEFNRQVAEYLGNDPRRIIDFYGMVEQVGIIYPDCEEGYKHVPNFGDVIIRDIFTMKEVDVGETGLIETLSVLPTSYPGQALLTEDLGTLKGIDDCKCGRKGKYFVFKSRMEKAEIRGCGDTFAQRLVKLGGAL